MSWRSEPPTEHLSPPTPSREVWHGVVSLRVGFSTGTRVDASVDGETIEVTVGAQTLELSRATAVSLRSAIGDAVEGRTSFLRTEGVHRSDGSYVVARRCAESSGNSVVFDSFAGLVDDFEALPSEFGAAAVASWGVTGSRRHMVVWHLIEHPTFRCGLTSRNPLRAHKRT